MILEIVTFLLFLALIGALLGGNSFGESTRKGCGCFVVFLIIFAVPLAFYWLIKLLFL